MTTDDAIIPTELRHGLWAASARMIVDAVDSDFPGGQASRWRMSSRITHAGNHKSRSRVNRSLP